MQNKKKTTFLVLTMCFQIIIYILPYNAIYMYMINEINTFYYHNLMSN